MIEGPPVPPPSAVTLFTPPLITPMAAPDTQGLVADIGKDAFHLVLTEAGPLSRAVLAALENQHGNGGPVFAMPDQPFWYWLIAPVPQWEHLLAFRYTRGIVVLPPLTRTRPPGAYWIRVPTTNLVDPAALSEALETASTPSSPTRSNGGLPAGGC
ncbi:hypothetical protein BG418_01240 [Streptomyces sp. CBMA152]|nr:hypothetical protein [Streptomyces sp. CBMA152]